MDRKAAAAKGRMIKTAKSLAEQTGDDIDLPAYRCTIKPDGSRIDWPVAPEGEASQTSDLEELRQLARSEYDEPDMPEEEPGESDPAPKPFSTIPDSGTVSPEMLATIAAVVQQMQGGAPPQAPQETAPRAEDTAIFRERQELAAEHAEKMKTYVPPEMERNIGPIVLRIQWADWVEFMRQWHSLDRGRDLTNSEVLNIIVADHWHSRAEMRALMQGGKSGPAALFDPASGGYKDA